MLTRISTGLGLAPLVVWLVVAGPPWAVFVLLAGAATLCLRELYGMAMPGRHLELVAGLALNLAILAFWWSREMDALFVSLAVALALPGLVVLARPDPLEGAAARLMVMLGGLVYITGAFAFAVELGKTPGHLMLAFLVVWGGDTGAYFSGRALGRHKLYELISPKKTMEGALGGLISSVIGAYLALYFFPDDFIGVGHPTLIALGLAGGAISISGDLVESALKRAWSVKDSGNLLPGHGGMLDRLDAFVFTCPFVAVMLYV